jgi:hypothetical protein
MTNKPQQPKPMAPPPLINKDDLLGPSKPVFKSASIGDNVMLTKVDEGGCFNESSLAMMIMHDNLSAQNYDYFFVIVEIVEAR